MARAQENDLHYVRKFIGIAVNQMPAVGPEDYSGRISVVLFNKLFREIFDYSRCCVGGRAYLQQLVEDDVTLRRTFSGAASIQEADHSFIDADTIGIPKAFSFVRG